MPREVQRRIIMLGYRLWARHIRDQRSSLMDLLSMIAAPLSPLVIAVPSTQCLTAVGCVLFLAMLIRQVKSTECKEPEALDSDFEGLVIDHCEPTILVL